MIQYRTHVTREFERWDNIAWHYYRDVSKMGLLIEANPHAPIIPCLPAGLVLRIPLIRAENTTQDLPPWK